MVKGPQWEKKLSPKERQREASRLGMRRLRERRPRLKWSNDTMTYAIVKAAAKGAGIPAEILYYCKKNKSCPDPRICTTIVEYSEGLLKIEDFRTDVDGNLLDWEAVRVTRGGEA
jgi:hypothetical protein